MKRPSLTPPPDAELAASQETMASGQKSAERPVERALETGVTRKCIDEYTALHFVAGRLSEARAERVERHLLECAVCRELATVVSQELDASTSPGASGDARWGVVLPRGTVLAGRHRIEGFVARGGMGEVYRALDTALGDTVAIKLVSPLYSGNPEAIAQFKAEVQLARRIGHKNVCRIHDIGTHTISHGGPITFLTMEFIDGESLGQRLERDGRIDVMLARSLARGILEGLGAAHEAGVLHRDLKSDNVMLRREAGSRLVPVLMDFGLASALNPNSSRVSSDQALVGSLAYMAPEQVQGEPLRVATDIYAFGIILFEMLTGRLPFQSATPAIGALKRLQEPAPLLRTVDATLPADLEMLVDKCLQLDPKARFQSAEEALNSLAGLGTTTNSAPGFASDAATVSPGSTLRSAIRHGNSRRRGLLLGFGVLLLAAGLYALKQPRRQHAATEPSDKSLGTAHPGPIGTLNAGFDVPDLTLPPGPPLVPESAPAKDGIAEAPAAQPALEVTEPAPSAATGVRTALVSPAPSTGATSKPKPATASRPGAPTRTKAPSTWASSGASSAAPSLAQSASAPRSTVPSAAPPPATATSTAPPPATATSTAPPPATATSTAPPPATATARRCPPGLLCP